MSSAKTAKAQEPDLGRQNLGDTPVVVEVVLQQVGAEMTAIEVAIFTLSAVASTLPSHFSSAWSSPTWSFDTLLS